MSKSRFSVKLLTLSIVGFLLLCLPLAQAGLVDPTRPPGVSSAKPAGPAKPRWVLNSTLIAPQRRVAIINGQRVVRGDKVNGATVIGIDAGGVLLRKNGHDFRIYLLPRRLKKVSG